MNNSGLSIIVIPISLGIGAMLFIGLYLLGKGNPATLQPSPSSNAPLGQQTTTNAANTSIYIKRPKATEHTTTTPMPELIWQIFSGSSFTLSYPTSWIAHVTAASPQATIVTIKPYGEEGQTVRLVIQETPDSDSMASGIDTTRTSLGYKKYQVTIARLPAIKYTGTLPGTQLSITETNYVIRTSGKLLYLSYVYPQNQMADTYAAIFTQIVDSFKLAQ